MSLILRRNPPRRRTVSFDGSKEDKDPCCSCKNCEEKDTCCLCLSSDSEDEHDERLDQLRKALPAAEETVAVKGDHDHVRKDTQK